MDFEEHRSHLRSVAYRMLGSLAEADDAVQEAWLKLERADPTDIANPRGWLTTVVARVCLDMLRSRKSRREDIGPIPERAGAIDPETELQLANSVGLALLVVLEMLDPAERLAFVLHDLFAVPFDEIAAIVGRSPDATRQLASRARRRVQGAEPPPADIAKQRIVVDAFLTAARGGDFNALVAVLDPDVTIRLDSPHPIELRGADVVARRTIKGGARAAQPALIDGHVGVIIAPRGRLTMVLQLTFVGDKIVAIDAVGDPARLAQLDLAVL